MEDRIIKVIKYAIILLLVGTLYLVWCRVTGIRIPCLFKLHTGLYCPGCGITHMFVELSKLHFVEAFKYNPVVFVLMPIWCVLLANFTRKYILFGVTQMNQLKQIVLWLSVGCLMVFFFIRNIENYDYFFSNIHSVIKSFLVIPKFIYY